MKIQHNERIALLSTVIVTLAGWTLLIASLAQGLRHPGIV
jgi:hypothetical protein